MFYSLHGGVPQSETVFTGNIPKTARAQSNSSGGEPTKLSEDSNMHKQFAPKTSMSNGRQSQGDIMDFFSFPKQETQTKIVHVQKSNSWTAKQIRRTLLFLQQVAESTKGQS